METKEITSVIEYITEVNRLMEESKFKFKTHTAFFRGHADEQWKLCPSLLRDEGFIENEHLMYRTIVAKQTSEFTTCSSTLDHLVKMQHYGMPTRLLDLTTNPLVALFFACETHQATRRSVKGKTGEVIVLKVPIHSIKHYDSDTVSVIANVTKCKENEMEIGLYSDQWSDGSFYDGLNLKKKNRYLHHIGKYYASSALKELDGKNNVSERAQVLLESLSQFTKENELDGFSFRGNNGEFKENKEVQEEIERIVEKLEPYKQDMIKKILPSLSKETSLESENYRAWFNELGEIKLLLHQISLEKSHFLPSIIPQDLSRVCIVHSKQDNQRIRNQMGYFVLFGLGLLIKEESLMLSKKGEIQIPEEWNLSLQTKITIAPEHKKKIIDELALLGISRSFIYPKLETLSEELKNQYKKG